MPDAIHVATAKLYGCAAFITADRRLSVPDGMRTIDLDASTVDKIRALA
jgi:predicted nucleic acid-binding protein